MSLIKVRTVNLVELSQGFEGKASSSSTYRRLQRFFEKFRIAVGATGKFVINRFCKDENGFFLAMDRSNWQYGKSNINILMFSMVYRKLAIPLYWKLLNKKGSSNTNERISGMKEFIKNYGKARIKALLADREFVGRKWFKFLIREQIPFFIRIKNNTVVHAFGNVRFSARQLFEGLRVNEIRTIDVAQIDGNIVSLSGRINEKGEFVIVATNTDALNAMEIYSRRWNIETLFGFLKSKGFNFEATHITNHEKISTMITILTIAFAWSVKVGEYREAAVPIKVKKHGRKQISIFRYGLDFIREILLNPIRSKTSRIILKCINLLDEKQIIREAV